LLHSAAVIVFLLAPCHHCALLLLLYEFSYRSAIAIGKRGSSAAGVTAAAAKKAKTGDKASDADVPTVGNWVQTKFLERDL
jgi:hypothetical protein